MEVSSYVADDLEQNRKKLDVAYFRTYKIWKFKRKRAKILNCVRIEIANDDRTHRYIYQFGYKKFPKDLLYEIRKRTLIGTKHRKLFLFIRDHRMQKVDPSLWRITNEMQLDKRKWQRMRETYNVHPLMDTEP
jgi:hypothetical protein